MWVLLRGLLTATLATPFMGASDGFTNVATGQLQIQTAVPPRLDFKTLKENADVKVTDKDIEKGYTEVNPGTVISVSTNSTSGYIISVHFAESDAFSSVEATVEHHNYVISPGSDVDLYHAYKGSTSDTIKIGYRFVLSSSAMAAEYPWPIVVTVHPL